MAIVEQSATARDTVISNRGCHNVTAWTRVRRHHRREADGNSWLAYGVGPAISRCRNTLYGTFNVSDSKIYTGSVRNGWEHSILLWNWPGGNQRIRSYHLVVMMVRAIYIIEAFSHDPRAMQAMNTALDATDSREEQ